MDPDNQPSTSKNSKENKKEDDNIVYPITFEDFKKYTNVEEYIVKEMEKAGPEIYNKHFRIRRKYFKVAYKNFYTSKILRKKLLRTGFVVKPMPRLFKKKMMSLPNEELVICKKPDVQSIQKEKPAEVSAESSKTKDKITSYFNLVKTNNVQQNNRKRKSKSLTDQSEEDAKRVKNSAPQARVVDLTKTDTKSGTNRKIYKKPQNKPYAADSDDSNIESEKNDLANVVNCEVVEIPVVTQKSPLPRRNRTEDLKLYSSSPLKNKHTSEVLDANSGSDGDMSLLKVSGQSPKVQSRNEIHDWQANALTSPFEDSIEETPKRNFTEKYVAMNRLEAIRRHPDEVRKCAKYNLYLKVQMSRRRSSTPTLGQQTTLPKLVCAFWQMRSEDYKTLLNVDEELKSAKATDKILIDLKRQFATIMAQETSWSKEILTKLSIFATFLRSKGIKEIPPASIEGLEFQNSTNNPEPSKPTSTQGTSNVSKVLSALRQMTFDDFKSLLNVQESSDTILKSLKCKYKVIMEKEIQWPEETHIDLLTLNKFLQSKGVPEPIHLKDIPPAMLSLMDVLTHTNIKEFTSMSRKKPPGSNRHLLDLCKKNYQKCCQKGFWMEGIEFKELSNAPEEEETNENESVSMPPLRVGSSEWRQTQISEVDDSLGENKTPLPPFDSLKSTQNSRLASVNAPPQPMKEATTKPTSFPQYDNEIEAYMEEIFRDSESDAGELQDTQCSAVDNNAANYDDLRRDVSESTPKNGALEKEVVEDCIKSAEEAVKSAEDVIKGASEDSGDLMIADSTDSVEKLLDDILQPSSSPSRQHGDLITPSPNLFQSSGESNAKCSQSQQLEVQAPESVYVSCDYSLTLNTEEINVTARSTDRARESQDPFARTIESIADETTPTDPKIVVKRELLSQRSCSELDDYSNSVEIIDVPPSEPILVEDEESTPELFEMLLGGPTKKRPPADVNHTNMSSFSCIGQAQRFPSDFSFAQSPVTGFRSDEPAANINKTKLPSQDAKENDADEEVSEIRDSANLISESFKTWLKTKTQETNVFSQGVEIRSEELALAPPCETSLELSYVAIAPQNIPSEIELTQSASNKSASNATNAKGNQSSFEENVESFISVHSSAVESVEVNFSQVDAATSQKNTEQVDSFRAVEPGHDPAENAKTVERLPMTHVETAPQDTMASQRIFKQIDLSRVVERDFDSKGKTKTVEPLTMPSSSTDVEPSPQETATFQENLEQIGSSSVESMMPSSSADFESSPQDTVASQEVLEQVDSSRDLERGHDSKGMAKTVGKSAITPSSPDVEDSSQETFQENMKQIESSRVGSSMPSSSADIEPSPQDTVASEEALEQVDSSRDVERGHDSEGMAKTVGKAAMTPSSADVKDSSQETFQENMKQIESSRVDSSMPSSCADVEPSPQDTVASQEALEQVDSPRNVERSHAGRTKTIESSMPSSSADVEPSPQDTVASQEALEQVDSPRNVERSHAGRTKTIDPSMPSSSADIETSPGSQGHVCEESEKPPAIKVVNCERNAVAQMQQSHATGGPQAFQATTTPSQDNTNNNTSTVSLNIEDLTKPEYAAACVRNDHAVKTCESVHKMTDDKASPLEPEPVLIEQCNVSNEVSALNGKLKNVRISRGTHRRHIDNSALKKISESRNPELESPNVNIDSSTKATSNLQSKMLNINKQLAKPIPCAKLANLSFQQPEPMQIIGIDGEASPGDGIVTKTILRINVPPDDSMTASNLPKSDIPSTNNKKKFLIPIEFEPPVSTGEIQGAQYSINVKFKVKIFENNITFDENMSVEAIPEPSSQDPQNSVGAIASVSSTESCIEEGFSRNTEHRQIISPHSTETVSIIEAITTNKPIIGTTCTTVDVGTNTENVPTRKEDIEHSEHEANQSELSAVIEQVICNPASPLSKNKVCDAVITSKPKSYTFPAVLPVGVIPNESSNFIIGETITNEDDEDIIVPLLVKSRVLKNLPFHILTADQVLSHWGSSEIVGISIDFKTHLEEHIWQKAFIPPEKVNADDAIVPEPASLNTDLKKETNKIVIDRVADSTSKDSSSNASEKKSGGNAPWPGSSGNRRNLSKIKVNTLKKPNSMVEKFKMPQKELMVAASSTSDHCYSRVALQQTTQLPVKHSKAPTKPTSKVPKKKPTTGNAPKKPPEPEFVPQKTHTFRPLLMEAVKKPLIADEKPSTSDVLPTSAEEIDFLIEDASQVMPTGTASQILGTDCTYFESSQLLRNIDEYCETPHAFATKSQEEKEEQQKPHSRTKNDVATMSDGSTPASQQQPQSRTKPKVINLNHLTTLSDGITARKVWKVHLKWKTETKMIIETRFITNGQWLSAYGESAKLMFNFSPSTWANIQRVMKEIDQFEYRRMAAKEQKHCQVVTPLHRVLRALFDSAPRVVNVKLTNDIHNPFVRCEQVTSLYRKPFQCLTKGIPANVLSRMKALKEELRKNNSDK